jgi:hypothetical protein
MISNNLNYFGGQAVLQLTFSIFDDQSSNSATFSSKFSLIIKWIYKNFGTWKKKFNLCPSRQGTTVYFVYSSNNWDMKKHKRHCFIPFHSTKMSSTWSMSIITLVVTITNRPSQGSHKPVLIITTHCKFFKRHTWIYKYSIALETVVPTTITSLGIVFASFLYLINQTMVHKIMQHWWFFFHSMDARAW